MDRYGIRGTALHWFESYLTARQKCVHYNDITSSPLSVLHGVPHGSILGPLLFSIFVNDLPLIIHNASVIMYADDVTLIVSDTNINIAFQKMQTVLDCISSWSSHNHLLINHKKTHFTLFKGRLAASITRKLSINNTLFNSKHV